MNVLLHGFTGAPSSWDSVCGLANGPTLRPRLLGHGATSTATTFHDEVDRLAQWAVDAGVQGARLVGYSLGARLAAGLLVRHPGLFRSAVLIGANLGLDDAERPARLAWERAMATQLRQQGTSPFVEGWEQLPLWASQQRLPGEVLAQQRAIRRNHSAEGLATSLDVLGLGSMPDLRDTFAAVTEPVRLLTGALDAKFLALSAQQAEASGATRTVVPDAGHNVVLEAPRAVVAAMRWP